MRGRRWWYNRDRFLSAIVCSKCLMNAAFPILAQEDGNLSVTQALQKTLDWLGWGGSGIVAALAVLGVSALVWLISKWLDARLVESVRAEYQRDLARLNHEFSKKLEEYKEQIKIRAQAARTSELLALALSGEDEKAREFNKLVWELSLWLEPSLVIDLAHCLDPGSPNPIDPKEILVRIRKVLLKDDDDPVVAANILHRAPQPPPAV
jgi:hypothetical protein